MRNRTRRSRRFFLELAEGDCEQANADTVWRQVLEDRWFRAEVRLQARRVVGRCKVDEQWCDDVAQEIIMKLKAKLSKRCDLGADAEEIRTSFPGWLGKIIKNGCIDALRRQLPHPHLPLEEHHQAGDCRPQEDLRLDMAEAIAQLEERLREVATLKLDDFTIQETAEALELTPRQVECALGKFRSSRTHFTQILPRIEYFPHYPELEADVIYVPTARPFHVERSNAD